MMVIDYINSVDDCKNYLPAQGDYDDLFLTMIEYHLRAAKSCIVLDHEHLDGVAGQKLLVKDKQCTDMYIIFVTLTSKALDPIYILAVLRDRLLKSYCCDRSDDNGVGVSRIYVMYLLLEFSLTGEAGIFTKAKEIANLSVTMCSAETSKYCLNICEEIGRLEEDRYAHAFF